MFNVRGQMRHTGMYTHIHRNTHRQSFIHVDRHPHTHHFWCYENITTDRLISPVLPKLKIPFEMPSVVHSSIVYGIQFCLYVSKVRLDFMLRLSVLIFYPSKSVVLQLPWQTVSCTIMGSLDPNNVVTGLKPIILYYCHKLALYFEFARRYCSLRHTPTVCRNMIKPPWEGALYPKGKTALYTA